MHDSMVGEVSYTCIRPSSLKVNALRRLGAALCDCPKLYIHLNL